MLKKGSLNKNQSRISAEELRSQIASWIKLQKNTFVWVNDSNYVLNEKNGEVKRVNKEMPGVCGVKCGRAFAIEVRRKQEQGPTIEQRLFLSKFEAAGGFTFIAYSLDDVMWVWDDI